MADIVQRKQKIIEAVRVRVPIWQGKHKDHLNRYLMEKNWKEIGLIVGIPGNEASRMWKNLRQEFKKQLNKARARRSDEEPNEEVYSTWPFFDSLLFLKDQFLPKTSQSGNVDNAADTLLNIASAIENFDEDDDIGIIDSLALEQNASQSAYPTEDFNLLNPSNSAGHKRQLTPSFLDVGQDLKRLKPELDIENDEDVCFFKSLIPHVKTLNARKKMIFRMKTQQLLFELAYDEVQQNDHIFKQELQILETNQQSC